MPKATGRTRVRSFPAVIAADARLLILGSMPGVASLSARQYYAHPRNSFWPLMGELAGAHPTLPYDERLAALTRHGLALWDVLHSCEREGSLDADIEQTSAEPNDLPALLRQHPGIRRICCNGGTAHSVLLRHFGALLALEFPGIEVLRLPSTSPANAGWSPARKREAWKQALR